MRYISGRRNLAITIKVPFDCTNTCVFCDSRKEYKKHSPSVYKQFCMINEMIDVSKSLLDFGVTDVVFSGGEPLSNMDYLSDMTSLFKNAGFFVCVNTTLEKKHYDGFCELLDKGSIDGISISRHAISYEKENLGDIASDNQVSRISSVPVRINCVLPHLEEISIDRNRTIVDRWAGATNNLSLNFRVDYRDIDSESKLHSPFHPYLKTLSEYDYVTSTQCNVCHTDYFYDPVTEFEISLHRGMPKTSIERHDYLEINDIILHQNGVLSYDWDIDRVLDLSFMDNNYVYSSPTSQAKDVCYSGSSSNC